MFVNVTAIVSLRVISSEGAGRERILSDMLGLPYVVKEIRHVDFDVGSVFWCLLCENGSVFHAYLTTYEAQRWRVVHAVIVDSKSWAFLGHKFVDVVA